MISRLKRQSRAAPSMANDSLWNGAHRLLETPLSINGAGGSTILRWLGGQAAAGGWAEYGGAGTLALQTGTAPSYGQLSPYLGSLDGAVLFNAGGFFQAPNNALADIALEDIVFEAILDGTAAAAGVAIIIQKGAAPVWWIQHVNGTGAFSLYMNDAVDAVAVNSAAPGDRAIAHLLIAVNRSEASTNGAIAYLNAAVGSGVDASAIGTLATASPLTIGGRTGGSLQWSRRVLYFAMHLRANWHQEGAAGPTEWATVATQRFALLTATRPAFSFAATLAPSSAPGSSSPAYQRIETSGVSRLHYMGASSPRFERVTIGARTFVGRLIETQVTSSVRQATPVLNSTWTHVLSSASATAEVGPDGVNRTTVVLAEDGSNNVHHCYVGTPTWTSSTRRITISCFARRLTRNLRLAGMIANTGGEFLACNFDLQNGVTNGSVATGTYDDEITAVTGAEASIQSMGGGYYLCRVSATVTFGATADNYMSWLRLINDAFATSYQGLTQDAIAVFGVHLVEEDAPSSRVLAGAGDLTRAADTPITYPAANNVGIAEGAVLIEFGVPATFTSSVARTLVSVDDGSANNRSEVYIDANGLLNLAVRKTAGTAGDVQLTGSKCVVGRYFTLAAWRESRCDLWCREEVGALQNGTDATVSAPAGLTTIRLGGNNANAQQPGPILIGRHKFFNRWVDWGEALRSSGFALS